MKKQDKKKRAVVLLIGTLVVASGILAILLLGTSESLPNLTSTTTAGEPENTIVLFDQEGGPYMKWTTSTWLLSTQVIDGNVVCTMDKYYPEPVSVVLYDIINTYVFLPGDFVRLDLEVTGTLEGNTMDLVLLQAGPVYEQSFDLSRNRFTGKVVVEERVEFNRLGLRFTPAVGTKVNISTLEATIIEREAEIISKSELNLDDFEVTSSPSFFSKYYTDPYYRVNADPQGSIPKLEFSLGPAAMGGEAAIATIRPGGKINLTAKYTGTIASLSVVLMDGDVEKSTYQVTSLYYLTRTVTIEITESISFDKIELRLNGASKGTRFYFEGFKIDLNS